MKANIRNKTAIGLLVISSSALLFGCKNTNSPRSNPNKPTLFGCEYLDVSHGQLEFGKDAVFTISPKENSYTHLIVDNPFVTGEKYALKPFVGIGNPIYQCKNPLSEGSAYEYKVLDTTKEQFQLTVYGKYFTNALVISYRSTERLYTPEGKAEQTFLKEKYGENATALDIKDYYEESEYKDSASRHINLDNLEKYRLNVTNGDNYLCLGYHKFYIQLNSANCYLTDATTCEVRGINSSNPSENVVINANIEVYAQEIEITINNSEIYNGNIQKYNYIEFVPNIDVKYREYVKININKLSTDTLVDTITTPSKFLTHTNTPILAAIDDKDMSLEKEFTSCYYDDKISHFAWITPKNGMNFTIDTAEQPAVLNFSFSILDEDDNFIPCEIDYDSYRGEPVNKVTTEKLSEKFSHYVRFHCTQSNYDNVYFTAYIPNQSGSNKKMLVTINDEATYYRGYYNSLNFIISGNQQ